MRLAHPPPRPNLADEAYAADLSSVYCNYKKYPTEYSGTKRKRLADLIAIMFPSFDEVNEVITGPSIKGGKKGPEVVKSIKFAPHDELDVQHGFLNLVQWTANTLPPAAVYAAQAHLAAKHVREHTAHMYGRVQSYGFHPAACFRTLFLTPLLFLLACCMIVFSSHSVWMPPSWPRRC
jgi:hypothetical protein